MLGKALRRLSGFFCMERLRQKVAFPSDDREREGIELERDTAAAVV